MASTIREQAKKLRFKKLIDYCDKPRTMDEISKELGIVYNTTWRYCQDLVESGQLKTVSAMKNGKLQFVAGRKTPIPEIYDVMANEHYPLMGWMSLYDPNHKFHSETVAHNIIAYTVRIMYLIGRNDIAELAKLRDEITRAHAVIANVTNMYAQLLDQDKFWQQSGINDIRKSEEYDNARVQAAYDRWLLSQSPDKLNQTTSPVGDKDDVDSDNQGSATS